MAMSAVDPARHADPDQSLAGAVTTVLVLGFFALALLGGSMLSLLRLF